MRTCTDCNREFPTPQALHAHCRDRSDHAYCEDCERLFVHSHALQQHLNMSPTHQYDSDSDESDTSTVPSESSSETSDDDNPYCSSCNRWFVNSLGLYQHLVANPKHNWCFVCSRDFNTDAALQQHCSSPVHNNRDLKCPLCPKTYKTPSGIALHIESGACHNITRHQVTAAVHALRVIPTVSLSHRIAASGSSARAITQYSASDRAFNGTAYECYLCHRTFRTLPSLNTHLNSPAHDEDEFNCPKCKRKYKLISGLIQHIESEVCGLAKFQQIKDHTSALTAQFSRLLTL